MDVRRLPMRLKVPSFSCAGPSMICSSVPFCVVFTRAPRGSDGWNVAMPQWKPPPGASYARASGEPTITAPAPHANASDTPSPAAPPPRDPLRPPPAVAHAAVGDHVHVFARLEHVLRAGRLDVGYRGGL